jgi:putative tryptophan/tyrosine transport system substrate-binding protein
LTEAIPGMSRLALLWYDSMGTRRAVTVTAAVTAAGKLGVNARPLEVRAVTEAVNVLPSPFFNAQRRLLVKLAASYRLPAMYEFREYVRDGGLISYGVDLADMYRRSASYVDRILKGAKASDLPIERPMKFELVRST